MPQFLIETQIGLNQTLNISGDDAHHIIHVLRLKKGDWIVFSDGRGSRYRCEINEIGKKDVTVGVKEKMSDLKISDLTLAQAITKHDKLELIIQKAVELGIANIIPFTSTRTIPKLSKGTTANKIDRWNKIALEASKQCGLPIKPAVKTAITFEELIKASEPYINKLMFYEGEEKTTLKSYFSKPKTTKHQNTKTLILIGPEGGFTSEEVLLAKGHNFTTINLGPLIMRVETAAISAITLVQYFMGHFG